MQRVYTGICVLCSLFWCSAWVLPGANPTGLPHPSYAYHAAAHLPWPCCCPGAAGLLRYGGGTPSSCGVWTVTSMACPWLPHRGPSASGRRRCTLGRPAQARGVAMLDAQWRPLMLKRGFIRCHGWLDCLAVACRVSSSCCPSPGPDAHLRLHRLSASCRRAGRVLCERQAVHRGGAAAQASRPQHWGPGTSQHMRQGSVSNWPHLPGDRRLLPCSRPS